MNRFAALLERLLLAPQRTAKLRHLTDYFAGTPDPDRGWAIAAITRDLDIRSFKPAMLRELIAARMDPVLFELSYDYVGDLAETVSLAWPARRGANRIPTLTEVVETLDEATRVETPAIVEAWLDALDATGRWALIKLITGGLRIGVAARLVKLALADYGGKEPQEIEELWHGLDAPYEELFEWLEGRGAKPISARAAPFRPVMLANPVEDGDLAALDPRDFAAEWKWDGIRVQAAAETADDGTHVRRLYSRTGDDIGAAFPDILAALDFEAAIDGELLIFEPQKPYQVRPFGDLQQRLNRKTVSKKLLTESPAFIRAYDLLALDGEDLRPLPFSERRVRLERWITERAPARLDLSPLVPFTDWPDVKAKRAAPPDDAVEGLMLKRLDAPYVPGRPKGPWWKWKRDPHLIDAVLMYAQRGHGKRSSYYSDYTFGVWTDGEAGPELTPVGKAYFGFTDDELKQIDKFVREHTVDRFGPVRAVTATAESGLVLEVAFEGLNRSPRHKSGLAMRFPRIHRLRWDKPPAEADRLETLERLLP
ncbi:MAG: cisplatin damage response ATP-dependent DNA ligase [Pseudomonadota bacterium]